MTRKRYLCCRGKNSDVARVPGTRRKYECAFGEIKLARDLLHLTIRKAFRLGQHGQRIPAEARLGKHITGVVSIFHQSEKLAPPELASEQLALQITSRTSASSFMCLYSARCSRRDCRLIMSLARYAC